VLGLTVVAVATALTASDNAANFSAKVTNPYFPLPMGTTLRYRGSDEGDRTSEVLTVTRQTKTILGAPCVVLRDKVFVEGRLEEDTTDWYSQADDGTVWYFGEATRTLDGKGRTVSREGSWQAGVNGAKQGIFMPAHPKVGRSFRQEFYKGHAEDHFRILSLRGSATTPYRTFRGTVLVTEEWTPLEPKVRDRKYYARGLGTVKETTVKGGSEKNALVSVTHGR
jgi:hypothetical protein